MLGVLIAIRLLYRLITFTRSTFAPEPNLKVKEKQYNANDGRETFLDDRPVSSFLGPTDPEGEPAIPAEEDVGTMLDVRAISPAVRAGRTCTLCLEERTDSASTECGHLFCWPCIVGWGREKVRATLIVALNLLTASVLSPSALCVDNR